MSYEDKWVERCAAQFIKVANMKPSMAYEYAKTCFEMDDPADGITPEEAANNEIEAWNS